MARGRMLVFSGPMFAGKTRALLQEVQQAEGRGERVLVLKPSIDQAEPGAVRSHDGRVHASVDVSDVVEVARLAAGVDVVAIDEVQFLEGEIGAALRALADETGVTVIVAGLDCDFRGEPFPAVEQLSALADETRRLTAVCTLCGRAAAYTQRLVDGRPAALDGPVVLVGGADAYQPRCRSCFDAERAR